jgi:hypothetical protein
MERKGIDQAPFCRVSGGAALTVPISSSSSFCRRFASARDASRSSSAAPAASFFAAALLLGLEFAAQCSSSSALAQGLVLVHFFQLNLSRI